MPDNFLVPILGLLHCHCGKIGKRGTCSGGSERLSSLVYTKIRNPARACLYSSQRPETRKCMPSKVVQDLRFVRANVHASLPAL
mmetsp:Transcript_29508/g.73788  ORF Transcript_29508/g.73788 Transcript_29508/m.73788 type:complete len:84 (-) Transcript_29508:3719-3970(-)